MLAIDRRLRSNRNLLRSLLITACGGISMSSLATESGILQHFAQGRIMQCQAHDLIAKLEIDKLEKLDFSSLILIAPLKDDEFGYFNISGQTIRHRFPSARKLHPPNDLAKWRTAAHDRQNAPIGFRVPLRFALLAKNLLKSAPFASLTSKKQANRPRGVASIRVARGSVNTSTRAHSFPYVPWDR